MLSPILALIFALYVFLGAPHITWIAGGPDQLVVPQNGALVEANGATYCHDPRDGQTRSYIVTEPSQVTTPDLLLSHELIRYAECVVDGANVHTTTPSALDGSGCTEVPADCSLSTIFWAQRNPDAAVNLIERLSR